MTTTYNLDMDEKKGSTSPAKPAVQAASKATPKPHRNWVYFDDDQQQRFLRAQKKKGLNGASLLSMLFNEFADKEGL